MAWRASDALRSSATASSASLEEHHVSRALRGRILVLRAPACRNGGFLGCSRID